MSNHLASLVIDNINCAPGQDKQSIIKPSRLHGSSPVFSNLNYLGRQIRLPDSKTQWFVYQIGTLYQSPEQLNLYRNAWEYETWMPMTLPLIKNNLITTIFTDKGITFPLFRTFYMYTKEKAILIALQGSNRIPADLTTEDIYIRFYNNAFRNSARSNDRDYSVKTGYRILNTPDDILLVNNEIASLVQTGGYCTLTINGQRYKKPGSKFVSASDIVEWIYDPTIDYVQSYRLADCKTYLSSIDNQLNYILHSSSKTYFSSIAYKDDLEIDLLMLITSQSSYGAYLPIFDQNIVKMLTHRDYGVRKSAVDTIKDLIVLLNPSTFTPDINIEVKFRKSGFQRPILPTVSRVSDLYTLPANEISGIIGQDPVKFDLFSAGKLETSPYTKAMSMNLSEITDSLSEELLGYNAISKLTGASSSPVKVSGSVKSITVPEIFNSGFTAYEYDSTGQYLELHTGMNLDSYESISQRCSLVELISGIASTGPGVTYGHNNVNFNINYNYRVWACTKVSGVPTFNWVDITDTSDYTVNTISGIISWSNPSDPRYMMVRDDSKFTIHEFSKTFNTNLLTLQITEQVNRNLGNGIERINAEVPSSDLTLFMNSISLARNIDYFVDFPNVYITSFKYIVGEIFTDPQSFHYRSTGLGNGSGKLEPVLDSGSVSHGFVGTNVKYIPKNDKLFRITIDGKLKDPSTIRFSQDFKTTKDPNNINNGLSYEIKAHDVSIKAIIGKNQEKGRLLSKVDDTRLSNFMNSYYEFPNRGEEIVPVPSRLICPFHAKIVDDLLNGTITSTMTDPSRTDQQVTDSIISYMYLVNVSPCNPTFGLLSTGRFRISPHPRASAISLGNINNKIFISRVSGLIFPNAISNIGSYFI